MWERDRLFTHTGSVVAAVARAAAGYLRQDRAVIWAYRSSETALLVTFHTKRRNW